MEKAKTHGIKFIDKFGYALGDMGGVLTSRLSVHFKISSIQGFWDSHLQKLPLSFCW